jgi:hypothetical protein
MKAFEFAVLASLRAGQLALHCTPRVGGVHKIAVTAQLEVAGGSVSRLANDNVPGGDPQATDRVEE